MDEVLSAAHDNDSTSSPQYIQMDIITRIKRLLIEIGLGHLEARGTGAVDWPGSLSDGEKQLLGLARAFYKQPTLVSIYALIVSATTIQTIFLAFVR